MAQIPFKAARVAANMTQEDLANAMSVSRQTVNDWETGKRDIRPAYLVMFCQITGFSVDDIILPKKSTNSKQEA